MNTHQKIKEIRSEGMAKTWNKHQAEQIIFEARIQGLQLKRERIGIYHVITEL